MGATGLPAEASGMCVVITLSSMMGKASMGRSRWGWGLRQKQEDMTRTMTVRPSRHGLVERFRGQCRATVSQSGVDIVGMKTQWQESRAWGRQEGEGRQLMITLLRRRKKRAGGDRQGVARHESHLLVSEA